MVAPVRWATPGTEVVCAHQPACSAMSTIQSASTPPPWPPMARTAILIGEAARGAAEVLMLLSMSEPQSASCASARAAALQETDHRPAHAGQEPVAAGGVVDDVGAIERGAQHGGMGHFTAVAAAHAAAFHVRDRVFL